MKRSTQQRRLKWNLRQMSSAYAANLAFTRVGGQQSQHCIVAHTSGSNVQLAAETCVNFRASSIVVHGTLMYRILTFISVGHASLDDQSTFCNVSNRRDTHSGYYVMVFHRIHPRKFIVYTRPA